MSAFSFCEFYACNVPLNSAAKWFDDTNVLAATAIVTEGGLVWNKAGSADDCAAFRELLWAENIRAVSANAVPLNLATEWVDVADVVATLGVIAARRRTVGIPGAETDATREEA